MAISDVNEQIERAQRLMESYKWVRKDGDNELMRTFAEAASLCLKFAKEEVERTYRKDKHNGQESPKEQ